MSVRRPMPFLVLLIGLVAGAFAGRLLAHAVGGRFVDPVPLDEARWRVITPVLGLSRGPAGPGRITSIGESTLNITPHVFLGPDKVMAQTQEPVYGIDVQLAPTSAVLRVKIGAPPGVFVRLRPTGFGVPGMADRWQEVDTSGRYQLRVEQEELVLRVGEKRVEFGPIRPGELELSTEQGVARLRNIRVLGKAGNPLIEERFDMVGTPKAALDGGTVVGAVLGLLLAMLPLCGARMWASLWVLAPLSMGLVPASVWLVAAERLYLTESSGADLARAALGLSALPLVGVVLVQWIRAVGATLRVPEQLKWIWLVIALWVVWLGLVEDGALLGGLGAVFVLGWGGRSWRQGWGAWWALDLPALCILLLFSMSTGLVWAALWRGLVVLGTAANWVSRSPRIGVDLLLASGLILLPAAELSIRDTVLGESWNAERLSLERPNERGWRSPTAGWGGRCGPENPTRLISIAVAGGSSTGGAYQFGEDQSAFFTAVAHQALCPLLEDDTALITRNYGGGDRNTFTIRHSLEAVLVDAEPDLVVLYVGVNDLLTQHHVLTRKQRAEKQQARGEALSSLAAISRRLRLVTAADLLLRAVPDPRRPKVADVPLPDAKDNHEAIQQALGERGTPLLLLTEHVWAERAADFAPYRAMQRALASEHAHVGWFDVASVFAGTDPEQMLLDVNHLSRAGNERLGLALAAGWADRFGLKAGPATPDYPDPQ